MDIDQDLKDLVISGGGFVVTAKNEEKLEAAMAEQKRWMSFYASTRSYHDAMKMSGLEDEAMPYAYSETDEEGYTYSYSRSLGMSINAGYSGSFEIVESYTLVMPDGTSDNDEENYSYPLTATGAYPEWAIDIDVEGDHTILNCTMTDPNTLDCFGTEDGSNFDIDFVRSNQ